jgi:predicted phage terminase large subunit-like protein
VAKAVESGSIDYNGRAIVDRSLYYRRVVLSVDTASKETERADYTVAQVWAETHDQKYYLLDQKRLKVEFNKMIEMIESMARKHRVDRILVEDKGSGTSYIQARGRTEYQKRVAPAPLEAINPGTLSKSFRFDEISPMIRDGDVFIPENALWINAFTREVGQFPDSTYDDQVDAMSQFLRWAKSHRTRYGSKKIGSMG